MLPVETETLLLPPNPSFAGHQTFALRSGWLKKGVDALDQSDGKLFGQPDALVTLGVGKNMVQSIRHWLQATRMARDPSGRGGRDLEITDLGGAVFGGTGAEGWDPFLEDPATLWLLHWQLASAGSTAFSWVWAFNLFREYEFSKDTLVDAVLEGAKARVNRPPSRETMERDVECLLHCYVEPESSSTADDELDCPLRSLGLIQRTFGRHYRFQVGEKATLPPAVFAYTLATFWRWKRDPQRPLSVRDISYEEGSPGVVFKLDEDTVLRYLDGLEQATGGKYRFEDTPLVRQVIPCGEQEVDPSEFLREHYDDSEWGRHDG